MRTKWIWIPRMIAALIMLQTLFFKFTGAEESVYIFTTIGMEPWGRYGSGAAELLASILILLPSLSVYGALLAVMTMSGALFFHLSKLGIVVMNDSGQLFLYALLVFFSGIIIVFNDKEKLKSLFNRMSK
jgi:uncharacterized membrane protein YphA (DoxX/SURF4 family)